MAQTKDYYSVLGVSASATQDEIKKQYRRLAKKFHPDANKSDPRSADRFKEISEAYHVIGDADKRKQYDEMRRLGAFGGFDGFGSSGRRQNASSRPGGGPGGAGADSRVHFENFDIGGLGGLGDLFSSMFGGANTASGARGGAGPRGAQRGQAIEVSAEIAFRVAALGGKIPIQLEVNEECATCHGNGAAPGATLRTCPECQGRGTISFGQGGFAVNRPCPMCLGRGQVPSERCPTCNGTGEVRARRRVMITVPSGVETGTRIRLPGQGGKGDNGGPPGDLIVTFQVQPDRFFRREGLDIVATVPLNIAQATLGTKIVVRTMEGKKVTIRIPPGTAAGKRFRVRGQGIAKDAQRGDLIVETTIVVPEKLSGEQERLMKEFAAAGELKY